MVRCEEFYKHFEKKGNFCNKSEIMVKKIETYIDYIRRHKIGGYKISNCAIEPFINIEVEKNGKVHDIAFRKLKKLISSNKIIPEKVTRRVSIELINKVNIEVDNFYKLDCIPGVRQKMGEYEHTIEDIDYEVRNMFDQIKKDMNIKNNNDAIRTILEFCVRDIDSLIKINEDMIYRKDSREALVILTK